MGCGSSAEPGRERLGQPIPNGNVKHDSPSPPARANSPEKSKSRGGSASSRKSDHRRTSACSHKSEKSHNSYKRNRSRKSSSSSSSDSSHGSKECIKEPLAKEPEPIANQEPIQETKPDKEQPPDPDVNQNQEEPEEPKPEEPAVQPEKTEEETVQDPQPDFSEDVIKQFADLETVIKDLEAKNSEAAHRAKHLQLLELHKSLTEQEKQVEVLKQQTAKEYQDVVSMVHPSVRAMFATESEHSEHMKKEHQEYMDALNKQEVAEQEFNTMKEQYKNLYNTFQSEVETVKQETELLGKKRHEQEEILGKIFNDTYGSDNEWKLEMELDALGDQKERVQAAHTKWTNARKFLYTAANQILWALRRWSQIGEHNVQAPMVKYQMSAETRNHLVAGLQNVQSTHGFLAPLEVPYCKKEDLEALKSAINTIFQDVQVHTRYQQAYAFYLSTYNKCLNLLKWIDNVLDSTINKDLVQVRKQFHEKYYELKEERINLIQAKIKEKLGMDMTLELNKEEFKEVEAEKTGMDVATAEIVEKEEGTEEAPTPNEESDNPPPAVIPMAVEGEAADESQDIQPEAKPLSLSELAPPPSQDDLFGDIEQLKKKHEEEMAEFEKAQELNKTRVEQGLQEKLRARRSRRRKMEVEKAEELSLAPPPATEM